MSIANRIAQLHESVEYAKILFNVKHEKALFQNIVALEFPSLHFQVKEGNNVKMMNNIEEYLINWGLEPHYSYNKDNNIFNRWYGAINLGEIIEEASVTTVNLYVNNNPSYIKEGEIYNRPAVEIKLSLQEVITMDLRVENPPILDEERDPIKIIFNPLPKYEILKHRILDLCNVYNLVENDNYKQHIKKYGDGVMGWFNVYRDIRDRH